MPQCRYRTHLNHGTWGFWHMESTEVLYDPSEIVRRVVERYYTVKYTIDGCIDANGSSVVTIPDHPVIKAFIDMKNRGVRIRFISEINKDNL